MTKTAATTADPTLPLDGTASPGAQPSSSGQELAAHEGRALARASATVPATSDPMAVLHLMERMARNKEVDTTKLAQIREFGQAILNDQRRAAFDTAFAEMQSEMPTISARGTIEIRAKAANGERTGPVIQSTKYAKWEDINDVIKPVLRKHGFGLRFVTGLAPDGRVMVTGILSGYGHREESVFILPHDSTGSKNPVQAIGSSTSYGKRYAACALLNITTRGEDDNGAGSGGFPGDDVQRITPQQVILLHEKCEAVGCARPKFLKWANVEKFEDISAALFDGCMTGLDSFRKKS